MNRTDSSNRQLARTLLDPERSGVLVTDVQTSFLQVLPGEGAWIERLSSFLQVPKRLGVPILVTEQTPEKLGSTVDSVRQAVPEVRIAPKNTYDCMECDQISGWVQEQEVDQLILTGIMSNVCILQTALGAMSEGYSVHVASDGISATSEEDHWWALRRMERAGAVVTTLETVAHEWIRSPEHPGFPDLLPVLKELTH